MGHLPFVVAHGRAICASMVAAGGVLGVLAVRLLRTNIASGVVNGECTSRGRAVGALAAGNATISGRLRGRAATAIADNADVVSERSDQLSLDVGGTSVELRGDVEVIAGTRAKASWRGIPRGFMAKQGRGDWRAYELSDGDEVIATGQLENAAGTSDGAYREAAGGWVMTPVEKPAVIELCAAKPVVQAPALHPLLVVVIGAAFAGIFYLVLWGIGSKLVDNHPELAAAFPHVRSAALEQLGEDLEYRRPRSEAILDERLDLAELRFGCVERARIEGREERYEAELADACGDAKARIDALAHLGRYKEATAAVLAQHGSWPDRNGTIAIAAGDWNAAAAAADDLAQRIRDDDKVPDSNDKQRSILRATCYGAWFHAKAGDAKAAAQLATLGPDNVECAAMRAMLLPPDQRGAALAAIGRPAGDDQLHEALLVQRLAWAYGAAEDEIMLDIYEAPYLLLGRDRGGDLIWLAGLAMARRASDATDRDQLLAAAASLEEVRGHVGAAMDHLADARSQPRAFQEFLEELRVAIALHGADPITVEPAVAKHLDEQKLVKLRAGEMPDDPDMFPRRRNVDCAAAVTAALAGDGAPLAEAVEWGCAYWFTDSGALLAIAPRVHDHRAELAAAFRNYRKDDGMKIEALPFSLLLDGSLRRDLAALAGDDASAKHWQQLIDAQLPVLDDPDRVIALLLWQGD